MLAEMRRSLIVDLDAAIDGGGTALLANVQTAIEAIDAASAEEVVGGTDR